MRSGRDFEIASRTTIIWLIGTPPCFFAHVSAAVFASGTSGASRGSGLLSPTIPASISPSISICASAFPSGARTTKSGSFEFSDMRILKGNPTDSGELDTIVIAEKSAHPNSRRLRIGPYAYPFSRKVVSAQCAALRVVNDRVVLTATRYRCGNEHIGLTVISRLQIGDDRQFTDVEPGFTY